jgi:ribosomal protein L29
MSKKMKEFRAMGEAQLNERLGQLKMELIKFNTQVATGTAPKSPGLIRQAKHNVARILTLLTAAKKSNPAPKAAGNNNTKITDANDTKAGAKKDGKAKPIRKKEELKKE